jgi:hypothetical protein
MVSAEVERRNQARSRSAAMAATAILPEVFVTSGEVTGREPALDLAT